MLTYYYTKIRMSLRQFDRNIFEGVISLFIGIFHQNNSSRYPSYTTFHACVCWLHNLYIITIIWLDYFWRSYSPLWLRKSNSYLKKILYICICKYNWACWSSTKSNCGTVAINGVCFTISAWKRCRVCLYLQLFVGRLISYLRRLRFMVSTKYCVVFVLCFSSSMLPVSLDCQFLIDSSIFSNV